MLRDNAIQFALPAGCDDEATLMLSPANQPGHTITLTRELLANGETIRTHLDRVVTSLAGQIEGFQAVERQHRIIGGRAAVQWRVRWPGAEGMVEHKVVAAEATRNGRRVAYLFAATAPTAEALATWAKLEAILRTVAFEDEVSGVHQLRGLGQPPVAPQPQGAGYVVPMPGFRREARAGYGR